MNEIGGYIFVIGVALMTLCSIYVTFFLPEQDARYRTGYKNNEEVNESGGCGLLGVHDWRRFGCSWFFLVYVSIGHDVIF